MKKFLALILLISFQVPALSHETLETEHYPPHKSLIRVEGVAEKELKANKALLTFTIEAKEKSIDKASEGLSRISSDLMDVLKKEGLDHKNIEMPHFSIREITRYDKNQSKSVFDYYHAVKKYRLSIYKDDLSDENFYKKVSKIIQILSENGINQIENLNYSLSNIEEEKNHLLKEALINAKNRAELMLKDLDFKVGDPIFISEIPLRHGLNPLGREEVFLSSARNASYEASESLENTIKLRVNIISTWEIKLIEGENK